MFLDLWTFWYGPCIKSFPKINELEDKYFGELEVISISIDKNFELFKKGLDKHEVPGTLKLYAENAFTSDLAKFFQALAIPRYILIGADGKGLATNIPTGDIEKIIKEELEIFVSDGLPNLYDR